MLTSSRPELDRREFLRLAAALSCGAWAGCASDPESGLAHPPGNTGEATALSLLPRGRAPEPVPMPHFPDRLHAYVWRNWGLVPLERLASVVGARPSDLRRLGHSLGLRGPPSVSGDQLQRTFITVIKRNWHLLPYEQLLALLGWTPEHLAYTLREDDFLFIKLGSLKPRCKPLVWRAPDPAACQRARAIAEIVRAEAPDAGEPGTDPLLSFVRALSRSGRGRNRAVTSLEGCRRHPRFCSPYFALYGDPLLSPELDPYPDGYLGRLAACGVNGVWLQGLLQQLAPFPWEPSRSDRWSERLDNLRSLVERARRQGVGVWLYLNEPRALPLGLFEGRPELRGAVEGDYAVLCTSVSEVRQYLEEAVATLCRAVPDLAGFFTISASENLTHCWSHGGGAGCPRCAQRGPAEVIAELHATVLRGIRSTGSAAALVAWDWGWADAWAPELIARLPRECGFLSVSEWDLPVERGGVRTAVGEYSLSVVGPGPRAQRHWQHARARGLQTLAKIQAGSTWELSAVPYIPAVANAALHAARLHVQRLDGLMLGWTLGGYPSPNLEVVRAVAELGAAGVADTPEALAARALDAVAAKRFGPRLGPVVARAWTSLSAAFREFPYHGGVVYNAPLQLGPANPLWEAPTGYAAAMVGPAYDDLDAWRSVYPAEAFVAQLEAVATGFENTLTDLRQALGPVEEPSFRSALESELRVGEAAAIHFRSVANQARFVSARRALAAAAAAGDAGPPLAELERVVRHELVLARRLYALQRTDSRLGFEASNQYFYVPADLLEKILNCRDLLDRWLPAQRARWRGSP